jgi:hypothetical protein
MTTILQAASPVSGLTAAQRDAFERDGFLILPSVLTPAQVAHFTNVVDRLEADDRRERNLDPFATVEIRNAIAKPGGDACFRCWTGTRLSPDRRYFRVEHTADDIPRFCAHTEPG